MERETAVVDLYSYLVSCSKRVGPFIVLQKH
jgi:hypothetical protein